MAKFLKCLIFGLVCYWAGMNHPFTQQPNWDNPSEEAAKLASFSNFVSTAQPADAAIWSAFLINAKLCNECNRLQEYHDSSFYRTRPIVLNMKGDDDNVIFTIVFGKVGWGNATIKSTTPSVAFYMGHRSGMLVRIGQEGSVEYRTNTGWVPSNEPQLYMAQVRDFFQKKWREKMMVSYH